MSKPSTSPELQSILPRFYALQRRGIKVGLEHTRRLLERCGNPHHSFNSIHLAGTNGKGSTAAMLAAVYRTAGKKVGLYTSPHLIRFNERVRVQGIPVPDEYILHFLNNHNQDFDEIESTFFEATTALAFSWFAEQQVDIAIVETGLGGRLDSTNVLAPKLSIITPIDVDHTELLGKDVETIAREKGGIIKPKTPVVIAPQPERVHSILIDLARERQADIVNVDMEDVSQFEDTPEGCTLIIDGDDYNCRLAGRHQILNALVAIRALQIHSPDLPVNTIQTGLSAAHWPGRLQLMQKHPHVYYDVAHNVHGLTAVVQSLQTWFGKKPTGIMALKADKELDSLAPVLRQEFSSLTVFSIPDRDLMDVQVLSRALQERDVACRVELEPHKYFQDINTASGKSPEPVLIFGSHYIADLVFSAFDYSFDSEPI